MRRSSSKQPIKFTVTALTPVGVGVTNQRSSSDSELITRMGIRLLACVTRACEQVFRGALAAGREKEGELATMYLEFEFHLQFPCASP